MAYSKNAFNCHKCPAKGGEGGCPMWWETVHENIQTGATKIIKGCGYEQLPVYLIEVIKASNGMAASADSARNTVESQMNEFARRISAQPQQQLPNPQRDN